MKRIKWIAFLCFISVEAFAAPLAIDLLSACEDALVNGFQSKTGMMCIWYVTPCDCNFGKEKTVPRVCLPKKAAHDELAREVVAGLHKQPELASETAVMAAGLVLSPMYPCD